MLLVISDCSDWLVIGYPQLLLVTGYLQLLAPPGQLCVKRLWNTLQQCCFPNVACSVETSSFSTPGNHSQKKQLNVQIKINSGFAGRCVYVFGSELRMLGRHSGRGPASGDSLGSLLQAAVYH